MPEITADTPVREKDKDKLLEEQPAKEVPIIKKEEMEVSPETKAEMDPAPATADSRADSPDEQELEDGEVEDGTEDGTEDDEDGAEDGHHEELTNNQPPLPPGPPPTETPPDDGWQPIWDDTYQAYYFYNTLTGETTWNNPRVPLIATDPAAVEAEASTATDTAYATSQMQYNPAIHGDYDPTAPYAQAHEPTLEETQSIYTSQAAFNRFTGKFQATTSTKVPENYNDENKSRRQMEFYFDVDAAANSHDGRSLKAERQTKRLSKKELKQYKEKRKQRKEEKRKAWLKD
ncbi:hypothetical protein RUND412_011527 [Rhizina undulata]